MKSLTNIPRTQKPQAGFSFLSILLALLIVGILGGLYLAPSGDGLDSAAVQQIDRSKRVACDANRATLAVRYAEYQIAHGKSPSFDDLRQSGVNIPACPEGGIYFTFDAALHCTVHSETTVPVLD